jgi:hypothetical protein
MNHKFFCSSLHFFLSLALVCVACVGLVFADGVPVIVPSPAPSPGWLINANTSMTNLMGMLTVVGGVLLEISLRVWKTNQPRSLLYVFAGICHGLGSLFEKAGIAGDRIVQNVKPVPAPADPQAPPPAA